MQLKTTQKTRVMLGSLLLMFSFCTLQAQNLASVGDSQPLVYQSYQGEGELLQNFLMQLENDYEVQFAYDGELINGQKVNVSIEEGQSLEAILNIVLNMHALQYQKLGEKLYVIKRQEQKELRKLDKAPDDKDNSKEKPLAIGSLRSGIKPLEQTISGIVSDEDSGQPLPGVNVLAKGTTIGTVTDVEGQYRLTVGDDVSTLVFSSIGYVSQEVPINDRNSINISLLPDVQSLSEVVVVGYGTQKKADVTGSVASVSEEALQSRPMANFEDALQGRSSGVQVRQAGGDLSGKFTINIRGVGSVTGSNDPLVVVDGVPLFSGDFSTINPKDIASIDILKDASATAIYGSRAANGVVIVTTKKGKAGATQFTFSTDLGFEEITESFDVMSTEEQRLLFVEAFKNSNRDISVYDDPTNPAWQVDTDWQELGTRTAFRQNYNLGFSGGSEKTQFSGSASYLNREGTLLNSDLKSWSLRVNMNSELNDWLKITTNLTGSHQVQNVQNNDSWGSSGFRSLVYQHSFTPAYDEEGNLTAVNTTAAPYFGANDNPLIDMVLPTREDNVTRILGNTKLDVKLTDELVLSGNLGGDIVLGDGYTYLPVYQIGRFSRPEGSVTVPTSKQINWVSDLTLNYDKQINQHNIKTLLGFSAQQFLTKNNTTTGTGTIDNALNQLSNQTNFNASGADISARPGIYFPAGELWFSG
ncbi:TonB-linked SusC/RagA family outer membrane protein [Catalinimonas alkaloidigena]|uniref:SusC/RagA family TonB-linked outer membrane protein n=1 Tax=Catalinimonas alkaloidigena TaxID=1075417 RepID=UPI0024053763|nr:SusC/RagA family TonB-linked outer membrane protein [Catalinimonas alkaloidigena]MDF9799328.1 TonB-linked SusC/RagA family outer membrane protein [Catalinimonas alkaloidigena]